MFDQGHFCLCLFLLYLPAAIRTEEVKYVFEKVVPKPDTEAFQECHYHLVGTIFACWIDAAARFHVEADDILNQWPSRGPECCAVWEAPKCINVKGDTYPPCSSPEVVNYYKQVEQKYVDNGCQAYTPDKYTCPNGAYLSSPFRSWLLFLPAFSSILLTIFMHS